ncbi:hypothetical protein E2C01_101076 [Portunus trituberculatus]|uniref:Uncharacterized protein n=1 Tax=Portunus trituberculatus TaxID=210409 RepID=A0A5B7KF67_PORTR|nr:hypothetical protein [Portunus trituberculatus]
MESIPSPSVTGQAPDRPQLQCRNMIRLTGIIPDSSWRGECLHIVNCKSDDASTRQGRCDEGYGPEA